MNEYSYKELEAAAIEHRTDDMAEKTAEALAEWFQRYGEGRYWNGESYKVNRQYSLKLVYDGSNADWKAFENGDIDADDIPHHWELV